MPTSAASTSPWSHREHRREQVRRGLELSAEERLRWLEVTMEEMRALLGRAAIEAGRDGAIDSAK